MTIDELIQNLVAIKRLDDSITDVDFSMDYMGNGKITITGRKKTPLTNGGYSSQGWEESYYFEKRNVDEALDNIFSM